MSFYLIDIAYGIPFPSQSQKNMLVRLAGYANDEGGGIWPAVETLAYELQVDRRTVQRNLKAFRKCGLLTYANEPGGKGPGTTNNYCLDVDMMFQAARFEVAFVGIKDEMTAFETDDEERAQLCAKAPENRKLQRLLGVASGRPSEIKGGLRSQEGRPEVPERAASGRPNLKEESQGISNAGASARDGSHAPPAQGTTFTPSFTLTPKDPQWKAWVKHLAEGHEAMHAQVIREGSIDVTKKWPGPEARILTKEKPEPKNNTDRITGDQP